MVMLAQHLWILLSWEILEDGVNAASWLPRSSSSTPSWNLSGDGCHTKSCRLSLANRHYHHALLQSCDCNEGRNHGFPHENDKDDLDGIPNSWKPSCILNTGFVQALTIRTLKFQQEITRDMITYFLESASAPDWPRLVFRQGAAKSFADPARTQDLQQAMEICGAILSAQRLP